MMRGFNPNNPMSAADYLLQLRAQARANFKSTIDPRMVDQRPAGARPFNFGNVIPYPNGGVGVGGPATVISYTVPQGFNAVIKYVAIVHLSGGFVDGTGNVVWRVLINGGAAPGLDNQQFQIGSMSQPREIVILLAENDTLQITVTLPVAAAGPGAAATTAAVLSGWEYPIAR